MFERDYLMKLLMQFFAAVIKSVQKQRDLHDPKEAADLLEAAIGEATDIDASVLLSLSPESIASIMQVSNVDPQVTGYLSRGLLLVSRYLHEAGDDELAAIRERQAYAIAQAYGFQLCDEDADALLQEAASME